MDDLRKTKKLVAAIVFSKKNEPWLKQGFCEFSVESAGGSSESIPEIRFYPGAIESV